MLLTRYELKLRCHSDNTIYQGGLFRGEFTLGSIRRKYNTGLLDRKITSLVEKVNWNLHVPS